ncbi:hypothetical protein ACN4EE_19575 [Geminocystis sp. CENA526]
MLPTLKRLISYLPSNLGIVNVGSVKGSIVLSIFIVV